MRFSFVIAWALLLAVGVSVRAEGVWFPSHEFCGSATANVFDGGPPLHESGCIADPGDLNESYVVNDFTQPGSLGAEASATSGRR